MPPPRRKILATAVETLTPPDELSDTQQIVRALQATGNNIYKIQRVDGEEMLAELPARFRSRFWIKRGSYLVIDTKDQKERDNKIGAEVVNLVMNEKAWRKAPFWPKEFVKQQYAEPVASSDEEESRVGKMPSSDESESG